MNRLLLLLIVTNFFCSCSQKQNDKSYNSSNDIEEANGKKDVERSFGGKCIYSKDTTSSPGLTIKLSNSDSVEGQNANKYFGKVAETFCKNIKNRKSKYKSICVIFVYKDSSESEKHFLIDNLDLAIKKMPVINNLVRLIQSEKYDSIQSLLASYILVDINSPGYKRSNMINKLKDMDSSGKIVDFYPYDYWVEHMKDGKDMFQCVGIMKRAKQNYDLNIFIDAANRSDSIYMIIYKPEGFYSKDTNYKITKPNEFIITSRQTGR